LSDRAGAAAAGATGVSRAAAAAEHDEPFLYIPTNAELGGSLGDAKDGPIAWNVQGNTASTKAAAEQREKEEFERGVRDGEAKARAAYQQELTVARSAVSTAIEKFRIERESYFAKIEPEVVQLALSIARKILHREAQMDPLLLEGLVHVALEKIGAGARVRLWAHPVDIPSWTEHFSKLAASAGTAANGDGVSPQNLPELIGDPALKRGECNLETDAGSTHISLEAQLKEIEQGFFDLLEQRPKPGKRA
jgi:flagellar assembly protein FliH